MSRGMSYLYRYILLSLEKDIGVRDILSFYDIGWCTFGANYLPLRTVWGKYSIINAEFVYQTNAAFFMFTEAKYLVSL